MKASPKENRIFVFIIQHLIPLIFCLFSRSEHAEHKRLHVSSQNKKKTTKHKLRHTDVTFPTFPKK